MECKCGKEAAIELSYLKRQYCEKCFMHYLEQRIRKDIRMNKNIEPRDTLYLYDDGSKESFIARHFLKSIFGKNITLKAVKNLETEGKLVVPTNMDRYLSERLRIFLQKADKEQTGIPILDNVLEEEIVIACKILGREEKATEDVNMLIERMEEKYPDTKFSLHSAFSQLDS